MENPVLLFFVCHYNKPHDKPYPCDETDDDTQRLLLTQVIWERILMIISFWNVHENEIIDYDGQVEKNIGTTTHINNAKTTTGLILFPLTEDEITEGR